MTLFMGVNVTLDSRQRDGEAWWPHATLRNAANGQALEPVESPQPCATQAEADAVALRLAKRRIREALHQG
ncbi:MAG: hypothetical protein QM740_11115 [Acidovorax sp.]